MGSASPPSTSARGGGALERQAVCAIQGAQVREGPRPARLARLQELSGARWQPLAAPDESWHGLCGVLVVRTHTRPLALSAAVCACAPRVPRLSRVRLEMCHGVLMLCTLLCR